MQAPAIQILQEQFKRAVIDQNIDALQACLSPPSGDALKVDMHALCFKVSGFQLNALIYASFNGHVEVVQVLLAAGAQVNQLGSNGVTALMNASGIGHVEVVQALLAAGADVDKATSNGGTALMNASSKGHVEIVKVLLAADAQVNQVGSNGVTALMVASHKGHIKIVKVLLEAGAEVDKVTGQGKTALMNASAKGHVDTVRLLISKGAVGSYPDQNSAIDKDTRLISEYIHIIQQSLEVFDQDMNYLTGQILSEEYNQQEENQMPPGTEVGYELCYMEHGQKVIEAMRKVPDKHPESYVRLVEARLSISVGALSDAAEALCGTSECEEDLSKQYRERMAEEWLLLQPWDGFFLEDHSRHVAVMNLYVQAPAYTTNGCTTALQRALGEHIALQNSMLEDEAPDDSRTLKSIEALVTSIQIFDEASQGLTPKERAPRDMARRLLAYYVSRLSDHSMLYTLQDRLTALELFKSHLSLTMFDGSFTSGWKRLAEHKDNNDFIQVLKEARLS